MKIPANFPTPAATGKRNIHLFFAPLQWPFAFRSLLFAICFLPSTSLLFSQMPCAASQAHTRLFAENSNYRATHNALEKSILNSTLQHAQSTTDHPESAPLVLPIAVHIVHQNGPENLSDVQVETAIAHLNAAFSHTGYFAQNGAGDDALIQFCMARQTPDKKATNGITRTVSPLTDMTLETEDLQLKDLSRWNPNLYINIWLVRSINSTNAGPNVGGYSFMPAAHGQDYDGIVIRAAGLNIGPAQVSDLVHEMGHYLGLLHTFEGGCPNTNCLTKGDRVCDTPPDKAVSVPCPSNSCFTDADDTSANNPFDNDVADLGWNFMDYSPKSCYSGFTAGQGLRMRLVAESVRKSLLTSEACLEPCPVPIALKLTGKNPTCDTPGSIQPDITGPGPFDFRWSDGSSGPTLENLAAGTYTLTLTNAFGCTRSDTIALVRIAPTSVLATVDSVSCHGLSDGRIQLGPVKGGQPNLSFSIDGQHFQSSVVFENLPVGTYTAVVRDANGCTLTSTAEVGQPPVLRVGLAGERVVIPGLSFPLTVTVSSASAALQHIQWEPTEAFSALKGLGLQQMASILEPTLIRVTVTDHNDCTASDTMSIAVDKTRFVYFPNAIAPDGSGEWENERFTAYGSEAVRHLRWLRVFDRWGNRVFERTNLLPNDPQLGWDGHFQGQKVLSGVYIWAAEVEYTDGERKRFEGELSVVR